MSNDKKQPPDSWIKKMLGQINRDHIVVKWALQRAWEIDPKNMIIWTIISIIGALTPVVFLRLTETIIDLITTNTQAQEGFASVLGLISALVGFLFLRALYEILPGIIRVNMHTKYAVGMQKNMGKWIQKVPLRLFDDHETSTKIDMAMPTIKRLAFFLQAGIHFISVVIGMIALLVLATRTSVILLGMGVLLLAVTIPVGFYNAISRYNMWINEGHNDRNAGYYYRLVFDHTLAREFRTLDLEATIRQKWFDVVNPMYQRMMAMQQKNNLRWNLINFINTGFKFGILFFGVFMVRNQGLSMGGVVLIASLFEQLAQASLNLGNNFMNTYTYVKDLGFQKDLFEMEFPLYPPALQEPKADTGEKPVFQLQNVSYSYHPGVYALKDVSLTINKGEIVALVGSNGAGKSTLIKILLGLYIPNEGDVYFEGKHYSEIDLTNFITRVGVTFQDFAKFEFTMRENIAFGDLSQLDNDEELMAAAKKAGADKIIARYPDQIDTYLGKWYDIRGVNLSGGEWQRLASSRAHISDRDILILDEPASALDPIAEMEQFNNIKDTVQDRTAILISHRIGFARLADKIAVLEEGNLVEYGTHAELIAQEGTYYQMFTSQADWYVGEEVS